MWAICSRVVNNQPLSSQRLKSFPEERMWKGGERGKEKRAIYSLSRKVSSLKDWQDKVPTASHEFWEDHSKVKRDHES